MRYKTLKPDTVDCLKKSGIEIVTILIMAVLLCLKVMYLNTMLSNNIDQMILLGTLLYAFCVFVPGLLMDRKWRLIYNIFINFIMTVLIISDIYYYRYFKELISIRHLIYGKQLISVFDSVKQLCQPTDLILFIDLFIELIIIFILKYKVWFKNRSNYLRNFKLRISIVVVVFIIGIFFNNNIVRSFSDANPNLLVSMWDKIYIINNVGSLNYHIIDINTYIKNNINKKEISEQEKKEIAEWLFNKNVVQHRTKKYYKAAENKNVIIIQVEALQNFVINREINGSEITPNLNRLIKRSMYFYNMYGQTSGGGTSDAEWLLQTSLYPISQGSVFVQNDSNTHNTFAKFLKEKNYNVVMMHPYRKDFWNRDNMYKAFGFDRFFNFEDYKFDEHIGLGLSDKSFFAQSLSKIKQLNSPFAVKLITLTSHFPFNDTQKYGNFNVGEFEGTLLGNYLKSIHYADEQIGTFINDLEKEGILQNALFVVYGDHSAIPYNNKDELSNFLKTDLDVNVGWYKVQQVPFIIYLPDEQNIAQYGIAAGQIDMLPTIANLLGISIYTGFGQDLLNTEEGFVVFRDGSIVTDDYMYISDSRSIFNIKNNEEIALEDFEEKIELSRKHLEFSDKIINYDLIPFINDYINDAITLIN